MFLRVDFNGNCRFLSFVYDRSFSVSRKNITCHDYLKVFYVGLQIGKLPKTARTERIEHYEHIVQVEIGIVDLKNTNKGDEQVEANQKPPYFFGVD